MRVFPSLWLPVLAAAASLPAQADRPGPVAPPELDKLASATLEKWQKLRYHLEGAGVRSISFAIAIESKGGMTGTWRATATYSFQNAAQHPYGELTWEDEEIAAAMRRRGWTAEAFARDIRAEGVIMALANAKVTGQAQRNGTILVVRGGTDDRFLLFDRAGVQAGEIVGPLKRRFHYEEYRGRFLRVGETHTMPDTTGKVTITHAEIQGVLVPTRIHEVVHIQKKLLSDLTFVLSKHEIQRVRPTSRPAASATRPAAAKGTDAALALARRVQEYAGGPAALAQVRNIAFTFADRRRLLWDRTADKVRVESLAEGPKPGTRGRFTAVMVRDLAAQKDLLTVPEPPRQAPRVSGYSTFVNDTYWLLAPLKVLDPGVELSIDPTAPDDPAGIARLRLRFAAGTGITHRNEYVLHVEPDTGRVTRWDFYRSARTRQPRSWTFEGYRQFGDLRLSLDRRSIGDDKNITLTGISINATLPDDVWTRTDRYLYEQQQALQKKKRP